MTIADPLVGFHQPFSARVEVPNGDHPVTVTWADFVESDGETTRGAAYATVALSDAPETRRALYRHPSANDDPFHHHAVGVDSGVIMFIDSEATPGRLRRLRWLEKIDRERGCSLGWFTRSVGCSTAGFDRFYPVVLGYDRERLVRIHVDFMIAPPASAFAGRPGM
jgi:hypothetical protein